MALKLTVKLDSYPEGTEFGINGLGLVRNGETIEITPEMEEAYFQENGYTLEDSIGEVKGAVTLEGTTEFEAPVSDTNTDVDVEKPVSGDDNPQLRGDD